MFRLGGSWLHVYLQYHKIKLTRITRSLSLSLVLTYLHERALHLS